MPIPSSKAQLDLNIQLQQELLALGLNESQAYVDDTGSLVASFPPTSSEYAAAPTVAFFAHVDTADSFKGTDVKPIVHVNWKGDTIELPLNQVALDPRRQEALRVWSKGAVPCWVPALTERTLGVCRGMRVTRSSLPPATHF
eukprot:scaffold8047_cov417-Prasinococcus_capsulatus_cf.AAC.3